MDEIPRIIIQYTDESISTVHHSLRASRRRLVVSLLAHRTITATSKINSKELTAADTGTGPGVPVRQLAREIAAIEEDVVLEHATGDPYHNVYTSLIQTHLPELDDVDAIEYDSDRKNVMPDQNLLALAMVVASTSPITQMLFHGTVAGLHHGGASSPEDSIND